MEVYWHLSRRSEEQVPTRGVRTPEDVEGAADFPVRRTVNYAPKIYISCID